MGMCRERGSYWLVLLSQSAETPRSETCISLRNTMSCSDQEMQTHPLCRTSPDFGAGRQGRHWHRAGSSWRDEREGNHQPPSLRLSGSNRRCRGTWLETWLAGVCTCLPKATGLAAGLFPLTLHEHIKKNIPRISISVFSLESTRLWTSHCFLCEDGVLFSCMLNLPRASVFVELQHHLSDFQLCYISGIYFWATWFKMWVAFWEQLIHEVGGGQAFNGVTGRGSYTGYHYL